MNQREIRAFGLQRSGNHALIGWVIGQFHKHPWCFINDIRHGDFDPYRNYSQILSGGIGENPEIETLRSTDKRLLIYSYEDDLLQMESGADLFESIFDKTFDANKEIYLGKSEVRFDLLIIRDPYNFFASRLKKLNNLTGDKNLDRIAHNWKRMARLAIEAERNPREDFVVGNFNQWFSSKDYRRQLCDQLGGEFDDEVRDHVQGFGGGSSFEENSAAPRLTLKHTIRNLHKAFDINRLKRIGHYMGRLFRSQRGSQMKVNQRWQKMRNDPDFKRIISDPEIRDLSDHLFGEVTI